MIDTRVNLEFGVLMEDFEEDDMLFKALQSMELCNNCGKSDAKVPCMSGCQEVYYCTKECMIYNASAHRLRCRNLRCSKFNDSEDEEEDEDDYDDWESEDSVDVVKQKVRKPKDVKVDAATEKRIEDKIVRRLKQQEENRISIAIEQKMKEHSTNWKSTEMNNIALEIKQNLEDDGKTERSSIVKDIVQSPRFTSETQDRLAKHVRSSLTLDTNLVLDEEVKDVEKVQVEDDKKWTNTSDYFRHLKIVVWKKDDMGIIFGDHENGAKVIHINQPHDMIKHISIGDILLTVNGVQVSEESAVDEIKSTSKPAILKFSTDTTETIRDYTVKWLNGPLGLTLKDDGSQEALPIVHRLTKKSSSTAIKYNIQIGDMLIGINNIDTVAIGCAVTMSVLKKVQLPAKLVFRGMGGNNEPRLQHKLSQSSSTSNLHTLGGCYEVSWNDGPLGLTIIPGELTTDLPVVKRVTGKGTSPGLEHAQVGDSLLSLNGDSIEGTSFDSVVEMLRNAPKPAKLVFQASIAPNSRPPPPPILFNNCVRSIDINAVEKINSPVAPPKETPASSKLYEIVWKTGPLGLTIDAVQDGSGAFIKRLSETPGSAAYGMPQACVGDRLVEINGSNVMHMDFSTIVAHLRAVERPTVLKFAPDKLSTWQNLENRRRSAPSIPLNSPTGSVKENYDLIWTEGSPLGISLHAGASATSFPYIRRLTGTGCAAILPPEVVGDLLLAVNGKSIENMKFLSVMEELKTLRKPIRLTFQKADFNGHNMNSPLAERSASESSASKSAYPQTVQDVEALEGAHFSHLHTPFLGGPKLSSRRHQRIVQSVKK